MLGGSCDKTWFYTGLPSYKAFAGLSQLYIIYNTVNYKYYNDIYNNNNYYYNFICIIYNIVLTYPLKNSYRLPMV